MTHSKRLSARVASDVVIALALVTVAGCNCGLEPVIEQVIELSVVPESVDAGDVPVGAARAAAVVVVNGGNATWLPEGAPVVDGEGFAWVSGCDAAVGPGAACTAQLTFKPQREGPHTGTFTVRFPDQSGADIDVVAALAGVGAPATLVVAPAALDFGAVFVGQSRPLTFTLENRGLERLEVPLRIDGAGFFVDGGREAERGLDPGEVVEVEVVFAPSSGVALQARVVAAICGTACGPFVALTGVGEAPRIDVQPRTLDLGAVAAGTTGQGRLRIENAGSGALVVEGVDVDDSSGAFSVVAPPLPVVLQSGAGFDVDVVYAAGQGRAQGVGALVLVRSTDPVSGSVLVPVTVSTPGPGLEVLPGVGQYGFLDPGSERPLSVVLRSIGDAPVELLGFSFDGDRDFTLEGAPPPGILDVGDALQFRVVARAGVAAVARGGAAGALVVRSDAGEQRVALSFLSGDSGCVPRAVVAHVDLGTVQVGLSKSGSVVIENVGDAPCVVERLATGDELGLAADDGSFAAVTRGLDALAPGALGFVSFGFTPGREGASTTVRGVLFAGRDLPVLVSASGSGVRGGLIGAPGSLVLGPVPRDCAAPTATVTFFNDGASPVRVTSVVLDPPGAPFVIEPLALPFTLLPGATVPLQIDARMRAGLDGDNDARLIASTAEGLSAAIDLRLTISPSESDITQQFTVPDDVAVDVLFVVDNSGSMADDQQRLADNFAAFIGVALDDPALDVQLGITTTDVLSADGAAGRLVGSPPILGRFDGPTFAQRALVGVDGTGLELGLEAMRLALEVPENAGFIRPDAALAVIFITDEEDGGDLVEFLPDLALSRSPAEYIALLEARKSGAVQNTPVLVSAVVPPGQTPRYTAVVDHFGGVALDITSPDWGAQLSEIAVSTFALSRSFQLASAPRPGSVQVTVDGQPETNFTVDAARHVVVLDDPADAGADVVVTYAAECG